MNFQSGFGLAKDIVPVALGTVVGKNFTVPLNDGKVAKIPVSAISKVGMNPTVSYSLPVTEKWLKKLESRIYNTSGDALAVISFTGITMTLLSFPVFFEGLMVAGSVSGVITAAIAGLSATAITSTRLLNRQFRKQNRAVYALKKQSFVDWLKSRYNITVSDEVRNELLFFMNFAYQDGDRRHTKSNFVDTAGKKFTLHISVDNRREKVFYVVDAQGIPAPKQKLAAKPVAVVTSPFHGEAKVLFDSIMSRIAVLVKRDLTVEANHMLARVQEDMKQAIQFNDELEAFGEESSEALVEVLSELNQEVNHLFVEQLQDIKRQVEVQKSYIKSRQPKPVDSQLLIVSGEPVKHEMIEKEVKVGE